MRKSDVITVSYNYLAKRSSFRESSFVLTQANYRRLQRKVKRKWNKRIFFNLKSTNSHSFSTFTSCVTCWLAVNNMRPQQKLLFLSCVFVSKRRNVNNRWHCWQTKYSFLLKWKNMLVLHSYRLIVEKRIFEILQLLLHFSSL